VAFSTTTSDQLKKELAKERAFVRYAITKTISFSDENNG